MEPELESIFLTALDLTGDDRAEFLRKSCAGAPESRRRIENMLANEQQAGDYFDSLGLRVSSLFDEFEQSEELPDQIGDYRPSKLLGRGGMGAVYQAYRTDGHFDKEVAIKVLPTLLANPESRERFLRERQILAQLDHPNICNLLDGGVTPEGMPYFAMEYVIGMPIDEYADTQCLSIEERLGLFLQVCDAVECAHQSLILHRDIKPGNIMVSQTGQVKLLDFGVAKILDESDDGTGLQTTRLPLTPRFASPEQLQGQPVTTRADVYALGMLLYSLLTGVHAHKLHQRSVPESLRLLSEQEATLASQRLRQESGNETQANLLTIAQQRQLGPGRLIERLQGDLDNILAKALRLAPADRYAGASAFAEDVRRHLDRLPVSARATTLGYVASRFVERHRVPVALSAVIVLLMLALSAGAGWSAWRTAKQAKAIAAESARADATRDFLISVFKAAHPNESQGEVVTARQLVDTGAKRVQSELGDRPGLRADLFNTFADIYSLLGEYPEAESLWLEELALRQASQRQSSPENSQKGVAHVLDNLSRITSAQGRHLEALEFAERAYELRLKIDDPLGLGDSRYRLARLAHNSNELEEAEQGYREVLALYDGHPDRYDEQTMALTMLGAALRSRGNPEAALPLIQQALDRHLAEHEEYNAFTAQVLGDLGATQRSLGQTIQAEKSYERSHAIAEKLFGPEHRELAFALVGLASLAEDNGKLDLVEDRYLRALRIFENSLGKAHPNWAVTQLNLGAFHRRQGDCPKSIPRLYSGLEVMEAVLPSHGSVATAQQNLAHCLLQEGNVAEAESLLLAAYAAQLESLGAEHKFTRSTAADIAALIEIKP